MKAVNGAISLLLLVTGLMLVFYEPVPCGEEPTLFNRVVDFGYFFTQNLVPFIFLMYIYRSIKNSYLRAGLILFGAKMAYEVFILAGAEINDTRHVYYFMVFIAIILTVIITKKWDTFRKK